MIDSRLVFHTETCRADTRLYPLYILSSFFFFCHPTNAACDKREVSTCQWSLHHVVPMITALHHSELYCQTWFPAYRDLTWQECVLRSSSSTDRKKDDVSYFNHFYGLQKKLLLVGIQDSQFPFHPPTLIQSALGAINRRHFISSSVSQIHSVVRQSAVWALQLNL